MSIVESLRAWLRRRSGRVAKSLLVGSVVASALVIIDVLFAEFRVEELPAVPLLIALFAFVYYWFGSGRPPGPRWW